MLISVDLEGTTPSKLSRKAVCERSLSVLLKSAVPNPEPASTRHQDMWKAGAQSGISTKALYSIFNKELIVFLSAVQTALCHAGGCQLCIE